MIRLLYGSVKSYGFGKIGQNYLDGIVKRILKLIYYGVKPIFVFDGKAPEIKRRTLVKRFKMRQERKINYQKLAQRIISQ